MLWLKFQSFGDSCVFFHRLMLAALHFNENSRRTQAVTKEGAARYRIDFPKFKPGEYTVRKVLVGATYGKDYYYS